MLGPEPAFRIGHQERLSLLIRGHCGWHPQPQFHQFFAVSFLPGFRQEVAMARMHRRWTTWVGALVIATAQTQIANAAPATPPASNTPDNAQLLVRLQRLERDMRDLEAVTFRKPPGDKDSLPLQPPDAAAAPETLAAPMPDLNPLLRRIDELEEGLTRVTGQMEVLGHQVDQLTEKAERLQKQLDLQASAQVKAEVASQAAPPPPDSNQLASVTSPAGPALGAPPSVLGTIPADAPLPKPEPKSEIEPKKQFDAAMNLLSRARYDEASDAFRAYADAHPGEDRASDALYWTGDIAYSTKKDYPAAARDFAELLKKYPKAQRAPDGMLKLGLALFEMGQAKEACAAVAALPAKYPDASPAVLARAKSVRDEKKCR
jgi:tol-pal system protein YbgF